MHLVEIADGHNVSRLHALFVVIFLAEGAKGGHVVAFNQISNEEGSGLECGAGVLRLMAQRFNKLVHCGRF